MVCLVGYECRSRWKRFLRVFQRWKPWSWLWCYEATW